MKLKRFWEEPSEGLLIEWGGEEERERERQGNREEMGQIRENYITYRPLDFPV